MSAISKKPDLSEKITIRVGKIVRKRIAECCKSDHLDESLVTRMALEAGLRLIEQEGLEGALSARRDLLNGTKPRK